MEREASEEHVVTSPGDAYDQSCHLTRETPCPYLENRQSRSEAYSVKLLEPDAYRGLMARGFRRSGHVVYRPRCRGCQACVPLRVEVDRFTATRSMRRVLARSPDISMTVGELSPTREKFKMFCRYLDHQHDSTMSRSLDTFIDFLYDSPADTFEFTYRCGSDLVGVGIADRCSDGISSVYMYFDPAWSRRSPGTLSVLREIEHCRATGARYYYLGYYIEGCPSMEYKKRFRPNEILTGTDEWVRFRD